MRRALATVLGATGLIAGALVVTAITPTEQSLTGPFFVKADASGVAHARLLEVSVIDYAFATTVVAPDEDWSADGNWLIVTLSAAAPLTEDDAEIGLATLTIGSRTISASERVPDSLWQYPLRVGIETTGVLAFELPTDIPTASAELRLAPGHTTPALDDVIAISLDLSEAEHHESVDVFSPTVGAP